MPRTIFKRFHENDTMLFFVKSIGLFRMKSIHVGSRSRWWTCACIFTVKGCLLRINVNISSPMLLYIVVHFLKAMANVPWRLGLGLVRLTTFLIAFPKVFCFALRFFIVVMV